MQRVQSQTSNIESARGTEMIVQMKSSSTMEYKLPGIVRTIEDATLCMSPPTGGCDTAFSLLQWAVAS